MKKMILITAVIMVGIIASYSVFVSKIKSDSLAKKENLSLTETCFSPNKTKSDSLGLRFVSDEKTVLKIEGCK